MFKEIKLKNFGRFNDFSSGLEDLNIFLGGGNSGKTTLVAALCLLKYGSPYPDIFRQNHFGSEKNRLIFNDPEQEASIEITFRRWTFNENEERAFCSFAQTVFGFEQYYDHFDRGYLPFDLVQEFLKTTVIYDPSILVKNSLWANKAVINSLALDMVPHSVETLNTRLFNILNDDRKFKRFKNLLKEIDRSLELTSEFNGTNMICKIKNDHQAVPLFYLGSKMLRCLGLLAILSDLEEINTLIIDEPFFGEIPKTAHKIEEFLVDASKKIQIMITTDKWASRKGLVIDLC